MEPLVLTGAAGAAGWAAWRVRQKRRRRNQYPTNLPITDPLPSREGVFRLGHVLPDEGRECVWAPWEDGEQHLGIFGTTNSGKSVLARNIITTAAELWGWDVKVADGTKRGIDFTFVKDSGLGLIVTKGAVPVLLKEIADEIERRAEILDNVRVPQTDDGGIVRAVAPSNLRDIPKADRNRMGLQPTLLVIDELAALLAQEDTKKKPISGPLLRIAAAGRFVGIHLVGIMQRGDADLLSGFIGNLIRARILVGSTDQTAEQMAHGSSVKVWEEMASAAGYAPDGLERAMRPKGRALVSGLADAPTQLVQLYRFDPITRWMPMDEYLAKHAPPRSEADPSPDADSDRPDPSGDAASPGPHLRLVAPSTVASSDLAPFGEGGAPSASPASGAPAVGSDRASGAPRRGPVAVAARRFMLRLAAWRWLFAPLVPDPTRDPSLRDRVLERDGGVCSVCGEAAPWHAEHTRPLGLGGRDELANLTTMCVPDHRRKTKAERRVVAIKKRWRKRTGFRGRFPRPPAWQVAGVACLAAGAVDGRWVGHAVLAFAVLAFGPALIRAYLVPKPFRRPRGTGIDGVSNWDAKMEMEHGGYLGATARGYYGTRIRLLTARYAAMGASAAYAVGYWLPRYLL